ncbi:MAG: excinuclease ABC subunit UvrA [Balneolaceae bacterium]
MQDHIIIRGAREHNLKDIDTDIPREKLVVVTGLSGSGKSSLAFDTIYAEGQRRFLESLSAYARQFMGMMERPDVDYIDGLSPVISIDQKSTNRNPRSTVGTVTEIYDFLRLLYARAGEPWSWKSGRKMEKQTPEQVIASVMSLPPGTKAWCLAPVVRARKGHYRELLDQIRKQGYIKARIDGELTDLVPDMKLDRYKTHQIEVVVDRFVISEKSRHRITESVHTALEMADGNLILAIQKAPNELEDRVFSMKLFDPESGLSYEDPAPNLFSFNSPKGACKECNGLGYTYDVSRELVIPNPGQSISEGGIRYLGEPRDIFAFKQLQSVLEPFDVTFDTPIYEFPEELKTLLFDGGGDRTFDVTYDFTKNQVTYKHKFPGLKQMIREQYESSKSNRQRDKAKAYLSRVTCEKCEGGRLNREARSYRISGFSIDQLTSMDIHSLRINLGNLELTDRQRVIARQLLKEVIDRLEFLQNVGLGYLSLDREAQTLSGGEAQRIRLATQIGTQLTGVLYILDEPSIGLHQKDNIRLIHSLETLRDLGNTVIVVEHDRETIESADWVLDLGPGAGLAGGEIVSQGPPGELDPGSMTARFLRDEEVVPIPEKRRSGSGHEFVIRRARGHNLKEVDLHLALGTFTCVTGVSGSGKSSLINQTLAPILSSHFHNSKSVPLPYDSVEGLEYVDKVISIDQSPIGRTPRSNPGTYTKVFDQIRLLFAGLPEAKIRGYDPGRFSFNVKGGRCETCRGDGLRKIEMNFLPDVYVTCEECGGKRYNRETLEIHYKGKNISDVLEMSILQASEFFETLPAVSRKLKTLNDVGLGYLRLGQPSTTLSGGEAQRIKLARELSKVGTGGTIYIMDEPTTGLHFQDVRMLVDVIQKLTDLGNTVVVIEHNLDLIKAADQVIDIGPEGGDSGGEIIAQGTPEDLAGISGQCHTGIWLKEEFDRLRRSHRHSEHSQS